MDGQHIFLYKRMYRGKRQYHRLIYNLCCVCYEHTYVLCTDMKTDINGNINESQKAPIIPLFTLMEGQH